MTQPAAHLAGPKTEDKAINDLRNIGLEQDKALKRQGEEITAIEQLNEGLRGDRPY